MVITQESQLQPAENRLLQGMFEARKQVFVDLLKWELPVLNGRFELDRFDDAHARYVIIADDRGAHLGSARLLPTTRPHILSSLFPELCAGSPPGGAHISEITRFCLDRNQTGTERRHTRNRLVSALVGDALARGIRTYTGVAELGWLQQILAFGWQCRPLGLPRRCGAMTLGALAIDIDGDTPSLLAGNGIWVDETPGPALALEAA